MTAALSDYLSFQCRYINILTYLLTYLRKPEYLPEGRLHGEDLNAATASVVPTPYGVP